MTKYKLANFLVASLLSLGAVSPALAVDEKPAPPATGAQKVNLAVTHTLDVQAKEDAISRIFNGAIKLCESLSCTVVQSTLSKSDGSLHMRTSPEAFKSILIAVEAQGEIMNHVVESEDYSQEIIRTQASIKNIIEFRDAFRIGEGRNINEALEISKEISDMQMELAKLSSSLARLQQQTAVNDVNIRVFPEHIRSKKEETSFKSITENFWDSIDDVKQTTTVFITFLVVAIPWLVTAIILFFIGLVIKRFLPRNAKYNAKNQKSDAVIKIVPETVDIQGPKK